MQIESCEQSCEQAAPRERKGREKRNSPLHPLIEKREGKENRLDILGLRPSRACAGASCEGAREGVEASTRKAAPKRKRRMRDLNPKHLINRELDSAISTFHGTPRDRSMWAKIAWRIGPENFFYVAKEAKSSIEQAKPTPPWSEWPRIFQSILNIRYPKPNKKGGAA